MLLKYCFSAINNKLGVKRSLNLLQYSGYMMNVPKEQQILLSHDSTIEDRLVKAFFTHFNDHIKVYYHANKSARTDQQFNTPSNSWYKVVLPLSSNPELNFKFRRFYTNQVRTGRLLELMDYIASTVAYQYITPAQDATIVTAIVDNINFFNNITTDQDLEIQGYVNYVGSSSIEVQIDVLQMIEGKQILNVSAIFLMVARDAKDHSKAYKVPQLSLDNEADQEAAMLRQQIGMKNQETRKLQSNSSLYKKPPTSNEIAQLHEFFTSDIPKDHVQINDTKFEKNLLMHIQDRNLHGKIFGGYVMREAFELGWLNAYLHVKGIDYPNIFHVDDIQFIAPVDVGSTLSIRSRVSFVQDNILHVQVECSKILPNTTRVKTNDLHITFAIKSEHKNIPQVYPKTYQEGMMWLDAKRKLDLIS